MSTARARSSTTSRLTRQAPIFAALGDPTRLQLVSLLCAGGALSITQLTAATELSRQGVTKHLQVLADAGLVRDRRSGRERLWEFEARRVAEAQRALDAIAGQWDDALLRLQRHVDGGR